MLRPVGLDLPKCGDSEVANILSNQKEYSNLLIMQPFQHVQLEGNIDKGQPLDKFTLSHEVILCLS